MGTGVRTTLIVAGTILGLMALVLTAAWALTSPALAPDACAPGYERCRATLAGATGFIDCRIEVHHCRLFGPDHWSELLDE